MEELKVKPGITVQAFVNGILATIFLSVGVYLMSGTINLSINGIATKGTVVSHGCCDLEQKPNSSIVKFTLEDGSKHTQKVVSCSPSEYLVGDPVNILYLKHDITDVRVNSVFWLYTFPGLFIFLGLVALLVTLSPYLTQNEEPSIPANPAVLDA